MPNYRWNSPYEWLLFRSTHWTKDDLLGALHSIAIKTDSDTLQDIFQPEMDEDGYFDPIE